MDLKVVASRQRAIIGLILAQLVLLGLHIAFRQGTSSLTLDIGTAIIGVASIVATVMLALALQWPVVGVVGVGISQVVPLVGLIVLLIVNGSATKVLRSGGYRVGFLGAKPKAPGV